MTKVRLGHQPDQVVDLPDAEIEDLRRMGATVEEAEDSSSSQDSPPAETKKGK